MAIQADTRIRYLKVCMYKVALFSGPHYFFWLHKEASNEKLGWGMGIRLYKAIVYTYDASMHCI